MPVRRRLPWRLVVTLVVAALGAGLLAGVAARDDSPGSDRAAGAGTPSGPASPPAAPAPLRASDPCTVTVGSTTRPISAQRAKALTAAAARAYRQDLSIRALAQALAVIESRDLAERDVPAAFRTAPATVPPALAEALARVLRGQSPAGLTCVYPRGASAKQALGPTGLTPRAARLRAAIQAAFGRHIMGGFAPGGVSTGHMDNSAHYEGRAMDIFFRPVNDRNDRRGWTMAQWIVAHADTYDVLSVIWRERIWTVWASTQGWRDYVPPSGPTKNPILLHRDHIHTAVVGPPRTATPLARAS